MKTIDEKYLAKCQKRLKEMDAPMGGWHCTDIIDREGLVKCDLCDCSRVRFQHKMEHDDYFEPVYVGCVCAGILEGNILIAKERERKMKNRAKRKKNFIKRKWVEAGWDTWTRSYRKKRIIITRTNGLYHVTVDHTWATTYKGKPIVNFLSAVYAAFELADPMSEVLE